MLQPPKHILHIYSFFIKKLILDIFCRSVYFWNSPMPIFPCRICRIMTTYRNETSLNVKNKIFNLWNNCNIIEYKEAVHKIFRRLKLCNALAT
jgi:hypothetical protein